MKDIRQRISTLSFGATSVFSVLVVVVVFLIPARGVAQFPPLKKVRSADSSSGFVNRVFVDEDGEHRYAVFIPPNYTPHRRWPTVLFLHGASNRGTDGRSQLVTGLPAAIRTNPDQYPFLAVFPQCEDTRSSVMTGWTDDPREAARALRILSEVEREFSVDREHELLAGLSMGANGVYEIAAQDPQRWRGLIVVSGRCSESIASRIASIPLWVFHSRKDALIPFEDCQRTIDLIRDAGGHVNFSEVPGEAHDISAVTFTQSELARWVLHPEIPPQTNLLWTKPEGYTSGINEEVPFLPGAKLPGAIQVKVAPDLLVAVSEQLQEEYASQPLQGSSSPRQQSRRSLIGQFDVSVAGARYTGRVDQVQVTAEPSQVLRVQIGLRNVVMTIARTQIESPLVKANAGPVRIVVGHRAPVWITMNIAPSVHQERVRLRVVGTSFQIPSNNWSVQRPTYVNVRGLPFMKRRISDSIVEGIYQRKPEIEREVRQNIPQIVSQMESRLNNELLDQILVVGQIPVPMWQPRVKLTPESIEITEQGITAQLGITMAAVGKTVYDDNNFQMRVYPRTPAEFPMPATGAQLAISCQFVTALTELMIAGEVNTFHAQDLRHGSFREFADREFLTSAIPDLERIPPDADFRSEFVLNQPARVIDGAATASHFSIDPFSMAGAFGLHLPSLSLALSVRNPGERDWQPYGELEMNVVRYYRSQVEKPIGDNREVRFQAQTDSLASGQWRFAESQNVLIPHVDADRLLKKMIEARRESDPPPGEGNFDFPRMGNSGLTLESVPWQSGTLAFQFQKLTENEQIAPELDSPFTPLGTSYQANIRVFQEQPPANPLNPTTPLTTNGSNPFDRGGIQFRGSEFAPAPFTTRIPSTDIPGSNRITW